MSVAAALPDLSHVPSGDAVRLLQVVQELSRLRDLDGVMAVVRRAARQLLGADGATFVLREGEQVFYADEDAIAPLWKGRRFPATACISGWAILNRQSVAIPDVYADPRVPETAYRPTFVNSLLMVPIRVADPLGAIGAYWARPHLASDGERALLEALAGFTAVAVANAELYQEARAAVRLRDQWLSLASHELRTPLTPLRLQVQGIARALAAAGGGAQALRPKVQRAERGIERLVRLVEQLLDYTRFSTDGVPLAPEPFDLAEVARETCQRVGRDVLDEAPVIEVVAAGPVHGAWDRLLVEEVVAHLVSNAVKHGRGRPVTVEVGAAGAGARLVVRDQGDGIAPEDQERIFQPFMRVDVNRQGVGLGLWIVREIVNAHGGAVEVTSNPGAGAAFAVELPSQRPR